MIEQEQKIRKILMTSDTMGGVWTYTLDLCRGLNMYGIDVCLATMGGSLSVSQQMEADQISNLEIRQSNYKLEWMDNAWEDVDRAGEWLLSLEREVSPDLIHLNGYAHAALNWHSPVLVVAHSCILSWWQAVKKEPAPRAFDEYKRRVKEGLLAASAVVSVSHTHAAELSKIYGCRRNFPVVYNGRSAESFYILEKKNQAFAMGRVWDEAKNLSFLGRIPNQAKLPVLIAGNNRHPETGARVEVANVQLLGTLCESEIKRHLAESYIYILPARYEPFGLSVLEAALSGCILLLSDIPVFKELWLNTALYFNPDKPEELEELLHYVAEHPQVCQHLVTRSSARARIFSLNAMAENYRFVYDSLIYNQTNTETLNL
jgi:glycogen synthase